MSEDLDQLAHDDMDDGFAIGASEALIPRFEQAKETREFRKQLASPKEGRNRGMVRIPANQIKLRKGSGDGKARSPVQEFRVTMRGAVSPNARPLHSSVLGATSAVQGARSNPRTGSPTAINVTYQGGLQGLQGSTQGFNN